MIKYSDRKVKDFMTDIDAGIVILDKKVLERLNEKYKIQQEDIKKSIEAIKDGAEFGEVSAYPDSYYPCKFIRVIDEEHGIIEYEEPGINAVSTCSVLNLYIKFSI